MECDVKGNIWIWFWIVWIEFFFLVGCDVDDVLFYVLIEVFEINFLVDYFFFGIFVEYGL